MAEYNKHKAGRIIVSVQVSGHKNVSASSPRIVLMFVVGVVAVVGVVGVVGVVAGLAVNVTE